MEILGYSVGMAQLWLLFMLRTAGFIFVAPLLSAKAAPPQLRLLLTFFLTAIAFTAWAPHAAAPVGQAAALATSGMAGFVPAALSELALGMMLGFIVGLIFVTVQFAGQLVGYQMGFAIVNVLDPQSQSQVSLISEFLFAAVMLAFLNLNLHHDLIGLWYQSFDVAPPGSWAIEHFTLPALTAACDSMFWLALKIAMPLLAFLLLADLALGIMARVMPQMNVFIVGIPLKIAVGMLVLSMVVLQFDPVVRQSTVRFINHAGELLSTLAG